MDLLTSTLPLEAAHMAAHVPLGKRVGIWHITQSQPHFLPLPHPSLLLPNSCTGWDCPGQPVFLPVSTSVCWPNSVNSGAKCFMELLPHFWDSARNLRHPMGDFRLCPDFLLSLVKHSQHCTSLAFSFNLSKTALNAKISPWIML